MTKEKINRQAIQANLIHSHKGTVLLFGVLLGVFALILLLVALLAFNVVARPIEWVFVGVGMAIVASPVVVFFVRLMTAIRTLRLVNGGGFSIVKDTVRGMSRGEVISRNSTADVLYFTEYGRFIPSQTTFDLSAIGDEFYLVVLHTKKRDVCYAYHTKIYECDEIDDVSK